MSQYNNKEVRLSKNEELTVNGKPYVDVAKSYYYSTQYDDGNYVVKNIFPETIPVFNAVPKVVNIAAALAVGTRIEPSYTDNDFVNRVVDTLALEKEKQFITRNLILGKSILLEVQPIDMGDRSEADGTNKLPYALSYYPSDEYEIISQGSEILYAKITGVQLVMNEEETGYEEVEIEKVFIKKSDGTAMSYITQGEDRIAEIQYDKGILPLVEITTTYDMKQLFYSIDRHNELECFIRNIFYLSGEPILAGSGIDKVASKDGEALSRDRYQKLKMLYSSKPDSNLKLLEIQGSSARVMIEKQRAIVNAIIKDYPEYSISDVLAGSNVSEETTRIRLTEILSRVQEVRRNMEIGLNKIIGIVAFFEGKDSVADDYITFGNMTDTNLQAILSMVVTALENGLISKKSAMYQIRNLFIGEDVDTEVDKIREEEKEGELNNGNIEQRGDTNVS